MANVFDMAFSKVYPLLIAKAQRKGRTAEDVYAVTAWMTGYTADTLCQMLSSDITYGDFLRQAPSPNPSRLNVKGKVCGVQVDAIEDPLMRDLRILDKLVDELAKGWTLEKILSR